MTHIPDTTGCPLSRKTPYGMTNVSMTQLSVARYYGGCNFNGQTYTYFPDTDELVRDDVLSWSKGKKAKPANKQEPLL
jgi:hypothetical protein